MRHMKNLTRDDEGLIPLLIGVAVAGILGYSWFTSASEDSTEFIKVIIVASLVFTFGVIALMGKFTMPKFISFIIGIGCVGFSGYLIYLGAFPW